MDVKEDPQNTEKPPSSSLRNAAWFMAFIGSMLVVSYAGAAAFSTKLDGKWTAVLGLGVILLLSWFVLERQSLKKSAEGRTGKRLISSFGLTAMALSVAVAFAMIALKFDHQFDLTKEKRHSLSEQSISVLQSLEKPVKITAFFTDDAQETKATFEALTENMMLQTDQLSIEIYDPIQNNVIASQYVPLSPYGTVFLELGQERQKIEGNFSEEKLIGSLVQFVSGKKHTICFTVGHGEMKINDYENQAGLGLFVNAMLGQNYQERLISLVKEKGIPNECEVAIIAGPMEDFLNFELEMLSAHVKSGRHLIVVLDSVLSRDESGEWNNQRTPKLAAHMARFGLSVGSDLVLELSPTYQIPGLDESAFVMMQDSYGTHPIISENNKPSAFFGAREIKRQQNAVGFSIVELLKTSPDSRAGGLQELRSQLGKPGPISVMAVSEVVDPEIIAVGSRQMTLKPPSIKTEEQLSLSDEIQDKTDIENGKKEENEQSDITPKAGGKVLVSGAKSLMSNAFAGSPQFQNLDIGLNAVAWMVDETAQINTRSSKDKAEKAVSMTAYRALLLWIACLILAPGLVLMGAIGTWRRRRAK